MVHLPDHGHLHLETQQLAAGIRLVSALLCLGAVLRHPAGIGFGMALVSLGYSLWATARLSHTLSTGTQRTVPVVDSIVDVLWVVLMLRTTVGVESMLLVMLVQPFSVTTLVFGTRPALLLGACAIAAVLIDGALRTSVASALYPQATELALAVALITLCSTVLMHPIETGRRRRALLLQLTDGIDPRRGLDATTAQIACLLRQMSGVAIVALTLPTTTGSPARFSSENEGDFPASATTHRQIERLLADLPAQVLSNAPRRLYARLLGLVGHAALPSHARVPHLLADLGRLLQVEHLTVIPLLRDGRCRGHVLLGWNAPAKENEHTRELIEAAPELMRLIDTAELVDLLQDEAAGHERSRIGRDLHDSAIQPYLGLKFAVESVARRANADNPLHTDLAELADLVNVEIGHLREVISVLRTGDASGDNALVPALRRLVRRHAQLFGVEVVLDCPAMLTTSRALASAVFHIVSEALNNARKHTVARRIWVSLERREAALHVRIRDNAGTVLGHRMPDFRPAALSERAAELGGTLVVGHADNLDTELHLTIPA